MTPSSNWNMGYRINGRRLKVYLYSPNSSDWTKLSGVIPIPCRNNYDENSENKRNLRRPIWRKPIDWRTRCHCILILWTSILTMRSEPNWLNLKVRTKLELVENENNCIWRCLYFLLLARRSNHRFSWKEEKGSRSGPIVQQQAAASGHPWLRERWSSKSFGHSDSTKSGPISTEGIFLWSGIQRRRFSWHCGGEAVQCQRRFVLVRFYSFAIN